MLWDIRRWSLAQVSSSSRKTCYTWQHLGRLSLCCAVIVRLPLINSTSFLSLPLLRPNWIFSLHIPCLFIHNRPSNPPQLRSHSLTGACPYNKSMMDGFKIMDGENGLRSDVRQAEKDESPSPHGSFSSDERILARFGKRQQLRVKPPSLAWEDYNMNGKAHNCRREDSERSLPSGSLVVSC